MPLKIQLCKDWLPNHFSLNLLEKECYEADFSQQNLNFVQKYFWTGGWRLWLLGQNQFIISRVLYYTSSLALGES